MKLPAQVFLMLLLMFMVKEAVSADNDSLVHHSAPLKNDFVSSSILAAGYFQCTLNKTYCLYGQYFEQKDGVPMRRHIDEFPLYCTDEPIVSHHVVLNLDQVTNRDQGTGYYSVWAFFFHNCTESGKSMEVHYHLGNTEVNKRILKKYAFQLKNHGNKTSGVGVYSNVYREFSMPINVKKLLTNNVVQKSELVESPWWVPSTETDFERAYISAEQISEGMNGNASITVNVQFQCLLNTTYCVEGYYYEKKISSRKERLLHHVELFCSNETEVKYSLPIDITKQLPIAIYYSVHSFFFHNCTTDNTTRVLQQQIGKVRRNTHPTLNVSTNLLDSGESTWHDGNSHAIEKFFSYGVRRSFLNGVQINQDDLERPSVQWMSNNETELSDWYPQRPLPTVSASFHCSINTTYCVAVVYIGTKTGLLADSYKKIDLGMYCTTASDISNSFELDKKVVGEGYDSFRFYGAHNCTTKRGMVWHKQLELGRIWKGERNLSQKFSFNITDNGRDFYDPLKMMLHDLFNEGVVPWAEGTPLRKMQYGRILQPNQIGESRGLWTVLDNNSTSLLDGALRYVV